MHRATQHHRTTHQGNLHRSLYAALRCSHCHHAVDSVTPLPTRRKVAWLVATIKFYRARRALRHPVLWIGDRPLRRGTL